MKREKIREFKYEFISNIEDAWGYGFPNYHDFLRAIEASEETTDIISNMSIKRQCLSIFKKLSGIRENYLRRDKISDLLNKYCDKSYWSN
jgi:hypothetical protein